MVRLSQVLLFGASFSTTLAFKFTNIPAALQVGVPFTIEWDNEGDIPERLVMQHEDASGHATVQYELIVEWRHGAPDVTSLTWTPNVPGPNFQFEMWGVRSGLDGSEKFAIHAADGTPVASPDKNIEMHSNLTPQSYTGEVWPPQYNTGAVTAPGSPSTSTPAQATPTAASITQEAGSPSVPTTSPATLPISSTPAAYTSILSTSVTVTTSCSSSDVASANAPPSAQSTLSTAIIPQSTIKAPTSKNATSTAKTTPTPSLISSNSGSKLGGSALGGVILSALFYYVL